MGKACWEGRLGCFQEAGVATSGRHRVKQTVSKQGTHRAAEWASLGRAGEPPWLGGCPSDSESLGQRQQLPPLWLHPKVAKTPRSKQSPRKAGCSGSGCCCLKPCVLWGALPVSWVKAGDVKQLQEAQTELEPPGKHSPRGEQKVPGATLVPASILAREEAKPVENIAGSRVSLLQQRQR